MDDGRSDLLEAGWREQPVGIAQLTGIVRRQFGLVLLAFVVSVAGGAAYIVLSDPLYTASASIYAETQAAQTDATTQMELDTHVELIRSDTMTSAVIDELSLDEIFDTEPGVLQRTVSNIRRWLALEILDAPNDLDQRSEMIRRVKSGLGVERVGNTAIIDISYVSGSKALSVAVADAFATIYVTEATARTERSFAQRVHRLQNRAEEVQRRVVLCRRLHKANAFPEQLCSDRRRRPEAAAHRAEAAAVGSERRGSGAEDAACAHLGCRGREDAPHRGPPDPGWCGDLQRPRDRVEQARTDAAAEGRIGGDDWAARTHRRRNAGSSAAGVPAGTRWARARAGDRCPRRSSAQSELKAIEDYAGSTAWSDLLQAERESHIYEEIDRGYLSDLENAYRQRPSSDVRLISNALSPLNPSSPNYKVVLTLAGMIGLVIGGGIALYREWNAATAGGRRSDAGASLVAAELPLGSQTRD